MKRVTPLLLALACLLAMLTGCGSDPAPETTTPTTVPTEPTGGQTVKESPLVEVDSNVLSVGNLVFQIPETFPLYSSDENYAQFLTDDKLCAVSFYVMDCSRYEESDFPAILGMQADALVGEDVTLIDAGTTEGLIGGFEVEIRASLEIDAESNTKTRLDVTFTDSRCVYTFIILCNSALDEDVESSYIRAFGAMLGGAVYTGPEPRFDFVQ